MNSTDEIKVFYCKSTKIVWKQSPAVVAENLQVMHNWKKLNAFEKDTKILLHSMILWSK